LIPFLLKVAEIQTSVTIFEQDGNQTRFEIPICITFSLFRLDWFAGFLVRLEHEMQGMSWIRLRTSTLIDGQVTIRILDSMKSALISTLVGVMILNGRKIHSPNQGIIGSFTFGDPQDSAAFGTFPATRLT
jgi:hypothetical protein